MLSEALMHEALIPDAVSARSWIIPEFLKLWGPPRGALLVLWGGASCLCEGHLF
jgi:hypothetical protein